MKRLSILTALLWMLAWSSPAPAADLSEEVFARYKDRVLQVRILDQSSGSKAGIGSGFTVSSEGHVVTNYHVIAELVNHPGKYRAEYQREGGGSGALELLGLDVVNDLALLRGAGLEGDFFGLEKGRPAKGEHLFSLGNPFDLGLTIVEGTYNGLLEKSLYEKIHFTGSINPGMSGGPTLNRAGRVVGVNVSTAGNQVSFLVPVRFVERLLKRVTSGKGGADLQREIRDQLFANQERYMAELLGKPFPMVEMNGFALPGELARYIQCWGDTRQKGEQLYEASYQGCASSDDIYLSEELSTGGISFRHELFRTGELGALRFAGFLERHAQSPDLYMEGDEESVTRFACTTGFLDHQGVPYKNTLCLRGYKKLEGLYDLFLTTLSQARPEEALHSTLVLSGVSFENALSFSRAYQEAIRWNP